MMRRTSLAVLVLAVLVSMVPAPTTLAGTQDFTLVNHSGGTIYSLYISETANDDWEEDVLGDDTLPDGDRLNITFAGRTSCLWDILAVDPDGYEVSFSGINLCESSVVVLRCDDSECWAEYE